MDDVTFAIGNCPSIPCRDAVAIAELLSHRRTVAAATAARKIKTEATADLKPDESVIGVELTRAEMLALLAALAEDSSIHPGSDAVGSLRSELEQAIAMTGRRHS